MRLLRSKLFWGIAVILFFGYWYFIGFPGKPTNATGGGTAIIAFGDSLTEGVGATRGNDYVSKLSQMSGKTILNKGRAGETTDDALKRLERDVLSQNPRLVILFLGGNDMLRRVPVETTKANLDNMISRIHDKGAMVALIGLNGMPLSDYHSPMYRELAAEKKTLLVKNALGGIFTNATLKADQAHPNDAGYALIAKRIYEAIRPYLDAVP